jgi:hypothetical protein
MDGRSLPNYLRYPGDGSFRGVDDLSPCDSQDRVAAGLEIRVTNPVSLKCRSRSVEGVSVDSTTNRCSRQRKSTS